MAFSLPVFNLNVDIYTGPWLTRVLRVSVLGNLAYGRRVEQYGYFGSTARALAPSRQSLLLLPPLTDVRSFIQVNDPDMVEVPSGSGRWYQVGDVEDIGKGFVNEHRAAAIFQASSQYGGTEFAGLVWPVPMT